MIAIKKNPGPDVETIAAALALAKQIPGTAVGEATEAAERAEAAAEIAQDYGFELTLTENQDGTYTLEKDGEGTPGGGVTDVQVNDTSVVTDGVANVPVANANTVGVARPGASLSISNAGALEFRAVGASEVKAGTTYQRALTPERQHASAFYGLAKAAGDTTQSVSDNLVGTYTDAAKHAILAMLGVSGIIGSAEGATASKSYAIGDAFLHAGALYKATAAIAANDAIVPGTNCEQTTIINLIKGA